jgi:hypothetical protein
MGVDEVLWSKEDQIQSWMLCWKEKVWARNGQDGGIYTSILEWGTQVYTHCNCKLLDNRAGSTTRWLCNGFDYGAHEGNVLRCVDGIGLGVCMLDAQESHLPGMVTARAG